MNILDLLIARTQRNITPDVGDESVASSLLELLVVPVLLRLVIGSSFAASPSPPRHLFFERFPSSDGGEHARY